MDPIWWAICFCEQTYRILIYLHVICAALLYNGQGREENLLTSGQEQDWKARVEAEPTPCGIHLCCFLLRSFPCVYPLIS